jgi:hypothetical protein
MRYKYSSLSTNLLNIVIIIRNTEIAMFKDIYSWFFKIQERCRASLEERSFDGGVHRVTMTTVVSSHTNFAKVIFVDQAMTLTKDSVLWNGLPQSGNIASSKKFEIH